MFRMYKYKGITIYTSPPYSGNAPGQFISVPALWWFTMNGQEFGGKGNNIAKAKEIIDELS